MSSSATVQTRESPGAIVRRFQLGLIFTIGVASLKLGSWPILGIYGLLAIAWLGWLRVPGRSLLAWLGAELIFLVIVALPLGWDRALFLLVRSLTGLTFLTAALLSLPPHSLAIALASLPLPAALRHILCLAGHYLDLLRHDLAQIQRSAQCRGLSGPATWQRHISSALIGALYLRSLDRAERVYAAMVARGYQGSLPQEPATPQQDRWLLVGAIAISLSLAIVSYLLY